MIKFNFTDANILYLIYKLKFTVTKEKILHYFTVLISGLTFRQK